jgi:hypothetical protein
MLWLMGNDVVFRVAIFGAGAVSILLVVFLLSSQLAAH